MTHSSRQEGIEAARRRAGLSVQQLWLRYMSFSGIADLVEVEAYLQGLLPLPPFQEDKLAHAVNERLDELYQAARVPYSMPIGAGPDEKDPLEVINQLLQDAKREHSQE
jgi:hypothetical protein